MNIRILIALLKKEVNMMRRNPIIPKIIVVMPLMVMLVIPLVANLDVKNVKLAIIDNDCTQLTKRIISDIGNAEGLEVQTLCGNHSEAMQAVEKGDVDVILTIPYGLTDDPTGRFKKIDIEANGVNSIKGILGAQYVSQSVALTLSQWRKEKGLQNMNKDPNILYLYNPTLNFRNYMIPALIGILLIIICGFLPTLNLVGEKESGTIDAINVSPVSRLTFVLAKLIPFWVIGMLVITIGLLVGWLVYDVIPQGNLASIYIASFLFILLMSGLGVVIANKSSNMLQSIFVMFAFIIIFQLMSGLFTPISSMPQWAQYITYAIPPRYFIEIMRSLVLKGTPVNELWLQFGALTGFAIFFLGLAALTYKKRT